MKKQKVTERIIRRAGLSDDQKRVVRHFYGLPTAGERTKKWVETLDMVKYKHLLKLVQQKIKKILQYRKRVEN